MTPFELGDIILVPFPFTDQPATKKRPAVVISSKPYNQERPDLIIMAVTSQIKPADDVHRIKQRKKPEKRGKMRGNDKAGNPYELSRLY